MWGNRSIALLDKVSSKSLNTLVELSGVLSNTVLHFSLSIEGSDEVELLGLDDTCSSVLLNKR